MTRTAWSAAALALALAAGAGCGRLESPPLEVAFRDSLVGAGKIVRVSSTSNEPLTGLEVKISAPSGETRTFTQDQLGGYESLEVGWKKLGGWQIPLGSRVEVRADGYFMALKAKLPETAVEE